MKYLYKQTGVIVESEVDLDSTIFMPVTNANEKVEEPGTEAKKTTPRKRSDKK